MRKVIPFRTVASQETDTGQVPGQHLTGTDQGREGTGELRRVSFYLPEYVHRELEQAAGAAFSVSGFGRMLLTQWADKRTKGLAA